MLTALAEGTERLRKLAQMPGAPRAEAEAEVKDQRVVNRAAGKHPHAHRADLNVGSMGSRKGRRSARIGAG
jgi:hypothetical protein